MDETAAIPPPSCCRTQLIKIKRPPPLRHRLHFPEGAQRGRFHYKKYVRCCTEFITKSTAIATPWSPAKVFQRYGVERILYPLTPAKERRPALEMNRLLRPDDRDVLGSPKHISEDLQSRSLLSVKHLKDTTQSEARNNTNDDCRNDKPETVEEDERTTYEVDPTVNSEDDVTVSDASDASDTNAMGLVEHDDSSAGGACQLESNRPAVAEHLANKGQHCVRGTQEPTHAPSEEGQIAANNSATKPANSCAAIHLDLVEEGMVSEEDRAPSRDPFCKQLEQPGRVANFQEVIQEAMQRSDESAQHIAPPRQPDSPGSARPNLSYSTSSSAKDRQGRERLGGVAVTEDIDATSLTPLEDQWTRYVSPEGYPYLYNAATGDSEWILENEQESIEEGGFRALPAVTITEDGGRPESPKGASSDKNEGMSVDGGAGGDGRHKETTDGGSVGTCDVSHSSQDTTDPDARWGGGGGYTCI